MSAPISKKAVGAAQGGIAGVAVSTTIVELVGQLPGLKHADPNIVRALGACIVALVGAYGAAAGAWLRKESDEFVSYAAGQAGKVVVDAEKLGLPATTAASITTRLESIEHMLVSKAQTDAEKLLQRYFPPAADTTQAAPSAAAAPEPAPAPKPSPSPTTAPAPAAAPNPDPALADDYQPAADDDPVLAN